MSEPTAPADSPLLDTTPPYPPVEPHLIEAAGQELRRVLRNMANDGSPGATSPPPSERIVRADTLVAGIAARGHESAAAAWAVHGVVRGGLLLPELRKRMVEVGTTWVRDEHSPFAEVYRNEWPDDPKTPMRQMGGTLVAQPTWVGIGPVPYEHILIRSTPALWVVEKAAPQRGRGRRPAAETDPKQVQADMKLYRDWKAADLPKKEFLRARGIDEEDGLRAIDRGRKQSDKLGNNSDG